MCPLLDSEIKQALLKAYRVHGRKRMPLPMLVMCGLLYTKTPEKRYRQAFLEVHSFIRRNWGNNGLFHRRRGVEKGGIALRSHVKL